jgi:hypothetical protein
LFHWLSLSLFLSISISFIWTFDVVIWKNIFTANLITLWCK